MPSIFTDFCHDPCGDLEELLTGPGVQFGLNTLCRALEIRDRIQIRVSHTKDLLPYQGLSLLTEGALYIYLPPSGPDSANFREIRFLLAHELAHYIYRHDLVFETVRTANTIPVLRTIPPEISDAARPEASSQLLRMIQVDCDLFGAAVLAGYNFPFHPLSESELWQLFQAKLIGRNLREAQVKELYEHLEERGNWPEVSARLGRSLPPSEVIIPAVPALLPNRDENQDVSPLRNTVYALRASWDDVLQRISRHTEVCESARRLREAHRANRNTPFYFALVEVSDCVCAAVPEKMERSMVDTLAECVEDLDSVKNDAEVDAITDRLYQAGFRPWRAGSA